MAEAQGAAPAAEEPGKQAVLGVAEAIAQAGPSAATAGAIVRSQPAVLLAPPASVGAKMQGLAPLTAGGCGAGWRAAAVLD